MGLSYYHEYRTTVDVDAWWNESAGSSERARVTEEIAGALGSFGDVRRRAWGDVVSVELVQDGRVTFSFQIASRTARLREPIVAPWPPDTRLDSLEDLLAAKMEALVSRGAPRDFRDIHTLCQTAMTTVDELWHLWARRRIAAGEGEEQFPAALAIRTHLERIERARPLEKLTEEADRRAAAELRGWFKETFLHGLV